MVLLRKITDLWMFWKHGKNQSITAAEWLEEKLQLANVNSLFPHSMSCTTKIQIHVIISVPTFLLLAKQNIVHYTKLLIGMSNVRSFVGISGNFAKNRWKKTVNHEHPQPGSSSMSRHSAAMYWVCYHMSFQYKGRTGGGSGRTDADSVRLPQDERGACSAEVNVNLSLLCVCTCMNVS